MIVDASAVLAILFREDDAARFARAIEAADVLQMSVVSYVEAAVRIDSLKDDASSRDFDGFMRRSGIELHAVTPELAEGARSAYRRYGKGNHEAQLNLGDCFAYALAKTIGEPLLFKGETLREPTCRRRCKAGHAPEPIYGARPALSSASRWWARSASRL